MAKDDDFSTVQVAADQLRTIVERIERLDEEKREVAEQIKEVMVLIPRRCVRLLP